MLRLEQPTTYQFSDDLTMRYVALNQIFESLYPGYKLDIVQKVGVDPANDSITTSEYRAFLTAIPDASAVGSIAAAGGYQLGTGDELQHKLGSVCEHMMLAFINADYAASHPTWKPEQTNGSAPVVTPRPQWQNAPPGVGNPDEAAAV